MTEILDSLPENHSKSSIFSILSFAFALITLSLIAYLFLQISSPVTVSEGIKPIPQQYIIAMYTSLAIGLLCSIFSIIRKEKLKWIKRIGIIINFSILILIIYLVLYAQALDAR